LAAQPSGFGHAALSTLFPSAIQADGQQIIRGIGIFPSSLNHNSESGLPAKNLRKLHETRSLRTWQLPNRVTLAFHVAIGNAGVNLTGVFCSEKSPIVPQLGLVEQHHPAAKYTRADA